MPKINLNGRDVDALEVKCRPEHEDWNTYQLEDGTELKMRLIVSEVFRVDGQFDQEGNPVYVVKSTNLLVAKSPDHLKKPRQT